MCETRGEERSVQPRAFVAERPTRLCIGSRRSSTRPCWPWIRRSAQLSRQRRARLARRQRRKRRRRRPSNVVMISPEYRVFTRAGHAMPDSADGPGRPANSESRSARVPRRRRALRRRRGATVVDRCGAGALLSREGMSPRRRPRSPRFSGKSPRARCTWRRKSRSARETLQA